MLFWCYNGNLYCFCVLFGIIMVIDSVTLAVIIYSSRLLSHYIGMYVLLFIRNDTGILKSIYMAQKLSAEAAKRKAARDLAYAKTPDRRAKKADAQRKRRADPKGSVGKDWDHKNQRWESPAQNRGNDGLGTKAESGKKYKTR